MTCWICLDGPDEVGKSTVIAHMSRDLEKARVEHKIIKEPSKNTLHAAEMGKGDFLELVREERKKTARSLRKYKGLVIFDRSFYSTVAYQHRIETLDGNMNRILELLLKESRPYDKEPVFEHTFLFIGDALREHMNYKIQRECYLNIAETMGYDIHRTRYYLTDKLHLVPSAWETDRISRNILSTICWLNNKL
ncbi:MAG: hypothetical protein D6710_09355 [Nitrospirae bacterium]|nr:MAG: hypothetical protein D6710_09355 [Nitrospirota bacterium]